MAPITDPPSSVICGRRFQQLCLHCLFPYHLTCSEHPPLWLRVLCIEIRGNSHSARAPRPGGRGAGPTRPANILIKINWVDGELGDEYTIVKGARRFRLCKKE